MSKVKRPFWQSLRIRRLLFTVAFVFGVLISSISLLNHAHALAPYQASDLLGQLDGSGQPNFTQDIAGHISPSDKSLSAPSGVTEDPGGHRLFVADTLCNRVLEYNLDSSNNLLDHTADAMLGQTSISSCAGGTTQSKLNNPSDLAYDQARNWLYVADTQNNRVLVFDVTTISDGKNALYVLGQPDFTHSNTGRTDKQFGAQRLNLAYDNVHQRLFVTDGFNSRILVFDMSSPSSTMAATHVLGQSSFTTNAFIDDNISFGNESALAYDPVHNRLFVADSWDNRVMVFGVATISDGMQAVSVLGQPDFATYNNPDPNQSQFDHPQGVFYDTTKQQLWVADWGARVLMFDTANLTNGMDASAVIGQPDFATETFDRTQAFMNNALQIYVDTGNGRVYVADDMNDRIMIFNAVHLTTFSLPDGAKDQTYAHTIATAGSEGTTTLHITAGSLPPGLSMNSSGQISGTPTTAGTYSFTVKAIDDNGDIGVFSDSNSFSITIGLSGGASQSATNSATTSKTSSGAETPTSKTNPTVLNDDPGYTDSVGSVQTMSTGDHVLFTLAGSSDTHTASIDDISGSYIDLTIASNPIHLRLNMNETKSVDVDRDGNDDLSVTLLGILNGAAKLSFRQLDHDTSSVTPTATSLSATAANTKKNTELLVIVFAAVAVLIAALLAAKKLHWPRKNL